MTSFLVELLQPSQMQFCRIFWIFPSSAVRRIGIKFMKKSSNRFYLTFFLHEKNPIAIYNRFLFIASYVKKPTSSNACPSTEPQIPLRVIKKASLNKMTSFQAAIYNALFQELFPIGWVMHSDLRFCKGESLFFGQQSLRTKCTFYSKYDLDDFFGVRQTLYKDAC